MKYALALSALAAAVCAQAPSYFQAISVRSASPIHYQPVQARNGKLFLGGGPPSSYCPDNLPAGACPPGNSTVLAGGDKTLSLGVVVPGGQQVYVAKDGSLSYTTAHSAFVPEGAIRDQFSREDSTTGQPFGFLNFENGWVACPASEGNGWLVFGQVDGATFTPDCLSFNIITSDVDGPGAWQY